MNHSPTTVILRYNDIKYTNLFNTHAHINLKINHKLRELFGLIFNFGLSKNLNNLYCLSIILKDKGAKKDEKISEFTIITRIMEEEWISRARLLLLSITNQT